MNKLLGLGSFALATAALGLTLFWRPEAPPAPAAPAPSPVAEAELRALERRVELLEESSSLLERKVFDLSRPRPVALPDGGAAAPAAAPPMEETAYGASGPPPLAAGAVPREELKEAVRAAQAELEAEQQAQRFQRFEARQAKAEAESAERWKKFTTEANLNGAQEQALNQHLEAERAKRKALMDEVRAGSRSFFEVRGELRETRQATDEAMAKVLSAEQLQRYTEVRREERRDARGGGGGGGGWQGGPPAAPR